MSVGSSVFAAVSDLDWEEIRECLAALEEVVGSREDDPHLYRLLDSLNRLLRAHRADQGGAFNFNPEDVGVLHTKCRHFLQISDRLGLSWTAVNGKALELGEVLKLVRGDAPRGYIHLCPKAGRELEVVIRNRVPPRVPDATEP